MSDNAFRWLIVLLLGIMAVSLYGLSAAALLSASRRLSAPRATSTPD